MFRAMSPLECFDIAMSYAVNLFSLGTIVMPCVAGLKIFLVAIGW